MHVSFLHSDENTVKFHQPLVLEYCPVIIGMELVFLIMALGIHQGAKTNLLMSSACIFDKLFLVYLDKKR